MDVGLFPVWSEYEGRGDLRLSNHILHPLFLPLCRQNFGRGGWAGPSSPVSPPGQHRLVSDVFVVTVYMQSCPTLCDPMDRSPPGSSVSGILQARILEWVHALLQGALPTQGLNSALFCVLHWQAGSSPLVPPGKPMLSSVGYLSCPLHGHRLFSPRNDLLVLPVFIPWWIGVPPGT